jgi:hypothetical protein
LTNPESKAFIGPQTLTKRELFAALALQGLLADPNVVDSEYAAPTAVKMANALIRELNKDKK